MHPPPFPMHPPRLAANLAALLLLAPAHCALCADRTWTNTEGVQITATLVESTADAVVLRRPDGKTFRVPLAKLSPADREHALSVASEDAFAAAGAPAAPAAPAKSTPSVRAEEENIVRNPGFLSDFDSWNKGPTGLVALADENGPGGSACVRLSSDTQGKPASIQTSTFPIQPGAKYQVTSYVRGLSGIGGGVVLIFLDADKKGIPGVEAKVIVPSNQTDWSQNAAHVVAPDNAAYGLLQIRNWSSGAGSFEVSEPAVRLLPR